MRAILSACLLLMAAACTVGGDPPEGGAVIEVRDAFILAPEAGRDGTPAGMHISLRGEPRTLVRAETPIATRVELHAPSEEDGMMRMRMVNGFEISEQAPLALEQSGNHLMLFGVTPRLEVGDEVDLVLTFEIAPGREQDILVTAEILPAGG